MAFTNFTGGANQTEAYEKLQCSSGLTVIIISKVDESIFPLDYKRFQRKIGHYLEVEITLSVESLLTPAGFIVQIYDSVFFFLFVLDRKIIDANGKSTAKLAM